jgi:uncharacterized membrane protein
MGLDLRKPIGWFFLALGLILGIYGLMTKRDTEMNHRSLDMNINLIWGGVLIVFGLFMLIPALLDKRRGD